jgi:dTDP-4-amino-4,6-dideoxygalactose transaminase
MVTAALNSGWVTSMGPQLEQFEEKLKSLTGRKFCLGLNSGTAALHLALMGLRVKAGDEVICPTFTFAASAFPVIYCNATPVFVDSDPFTWNISPELLEKAIVSRTSEGKNIAAVILVNLYGNPVEYLKIKEIATSHGIPVIEDAAESLGATYNGELSGSMGDVSVFSFNGNKILTTSGGGALLTDNEEVYKRALLLSTQANRGEAFYLHENIGYNYRLSNVLAGVGLAQLPVLTKRVEKRRAIFVRYKDALDSFLDGFQGESEKAVSNRWLSVFLFPDTGKRDRVWKKLKDSGIQSRFPMNPLHLQPVFKDFPAFLNGISADVFSRGLCLPSGSSLSEKEQEEIIVLVKKG